MCSSALKVLSPVAILSESPNFAISFSVAKGTPFNLPTPEILTPLDAPLDSKLNPFLSIIIPPLPPASKVIPPVPPIERNPTL
ncbi:hypothetical protein D3C84_676280 [compost metagenome]